MLNKFSFKASMDDFARKTFGMSLTMAHTLNICINCKKDAIIGTNIFTLEGNNEYAISGMCETCYDKQSNYCENLDKDNSA